MMKNRLKSVLTRLSKRIISDTYHAVGYSYTFKRSIIIERSLAYACQAVRDFYFFKRSTTVERIFSDAGYAVGYSYTCKRSTIVECHVSDADYWQSLIFGRNDNIRVRAGSQARNIISVLIFV